MAGISPTRWQRASPHLDRLLELTPAEREAYLAGLRAQDEQTAEDLHQLLAEHRVLTDEQFLAAPPPRVIQKEPQLEGVSVGAYRLLTPIGHGGMGSVWLGERNDGRFRAEVAVKLLNASLVGRSAERRFLREGTILARLTHPHIGRLLDAGVSATGQPYLVLERIDGRPIDRYCDEERLGISERIRLFLDIQSAVSHAHANLIVHRDLKPSNVLVARDGAVKLLDFGIAKLLEPEGAGADGTLLTVEGDMALTPRYAAPEQVTGGAITTATDVYALGVILFELLTGQHPTAGEARTPAEFVRAIADREPQRLSTALSGADSDTLAACAASRATTPDRLLRTLRGDLETIVAKALKRSVGDRYLSVAEFADDLRRFLENRPVTARADALGYRTLKFVRRQYRVIAVGAAVVLSVAALVVFYTTRLSAERDRARLEAARSAKVSELLIGLLTLADPYRTPDPSDPDARTPLDAGAQRIERELADEPELQARMLTMIGRTYERMGLHDRALPLLERAVSIGRRHFNAGHVTVAQSLNDLGVLYREQGDLARAEPLLRESLDMRRRLLGSVDKDVAVTLVELGRVLNDGGHPEQAEPLFRESLDIRRQVFGEEHRETAVSKSDLGRLLMRRGDLAGAEPLLRENVATNVRVLGDDHPNTAAAKSSLGLLLIAEGHLGEGEMLLRAAADVNRRVFGVGGLEYANSLSSLGLAVEWQGRLHEAQSLFDDALRIARAQLGESHLRLQPYIVNAARVRIARGDAAPTEPALRRVLEIYTKLYPPGDWRTAQVQSLLGAALTARHRYAEAEPLMAAADAALGDVPGIQARERAANRARLTVVRARLGRAAASVR